MKEAATGKKMATDQILEMLQNMQADLKSMKEAQTTLQEQVQELQEDREQVANNEAQVALVANPALPAAQGGQVDPRVRRYGHVAQNEHDVGNFRLELPTFNGEEGLAAYIEWESAIEFRFYARQLSELAKICLCATAFKGFALSLWRRRTQECHNLNTPFNTWRQVKEDLQDVFCPASYFYDIERQLHNTKQWARSVDEYYHALLILLEQGHIEEAGNKTIARFLYGLNDDIHWGMSTQRYHSLDDALDAAEESERKFSKYKANRSIQSASTWYNRPSAPPPQYQHHDKRPPPRVDGRDKGKT